MKHSVAIHRLIRRTHQHNRRVARSLATGLSLAESHLLIELQAVSDQGITELASVLQLTQGFVSRIVIELSKRGALRVTSDTRNPRKKRLALTAFGQDLVAQTDQSANESARTMLSRISATDQQRLVWLSKVIADGMGAARSICRASDSPFRVEQRRLTRACGFLSESMFGTTLSSTMWQILGEVTLSPVAPQVGDLASALSLASNSLSSMLRQMEHCGHLRKATFKGDKRSVILYPRAAGERLYAEVENVASAQISKALAAQPSAKVAQAVEAFHRLLNDGAQGFPSLAPSLDIVRIDREAERRHARGFIARALVREDRELFLPESFVTSKESCFSLRKDKEVLAVLTGDPISGRITSCGWAESVSPWTLTAFIAATLLSGRATHELFHKCIGSFNPVHDFLSLASTPSDSGPRG